MKTYSISYEPTTKLNMALELVNLNDLADLNESVVTIN